MRQPFGASRDRLREWLVADASAFRRAADAPAPAGAWGDAVSALLTAALLRAAVDVVLLPRDDDGGGGGDDGAPLALVDLARGRQRFSDARGVAARRWYERHPSIEEHPHVGRQWFASPAACAVFRDAIAPLWADAAADPAADAAADAAAQPPAFRIAVVNRPDAADGLSLIHI